MEAIRQMTKFCSYRPPTSVDPYHNIFVIIGNPENYEPVIEQIRAMDGNVFFDISHIRDANIIILLASLQNLIGLKFFTHNNVDLIVDLLHHLQNISYLDISATKNGNIVYGLPQLTNLTRLDLTSDKITDLCPLAGLTRLEDLDLSYNNIKCIKQLGSLTGLKELNLSENEIENIPPELSSLTSLARLNLHGNYYISNIDALEPLTSLTDLDLSFNKVRNVYALARLTELVKLNLGNNKIVAVDELFGLTKLVHLDLSENKIRDISPLGSFPLIKTMNIACCHIERKVLEQFVLSLNSKFSGQRPLTLYDRACMSVEKYNLKHEINIDDIINNYYVADYCIGCSSRFNTYRYYYTTTCEIKEGSLCDSCICRRDELIYGRR